MDKRGYNIGAALMRKWISRPPNSHPEIAYDNQIVTMQWALGFGPAQVKYEELIKPDYLFSAAAKASLYRLLQKEGLLAGSRTRVFGFNPAKAEAFDRRHDFYFQSIPAGYPLMPSSDLKAALGTFNLMATASGIIEPSSGDFTITVTHAGIFVRDSYDFNDTPGKKSQYLGSWNLTTLEMTGLPQNKNGWQLIHNSDFRDWRSEHGQGGDFEVFSDLKVIEVKPAVTFNSAQITQEGGFEKLDSLRGARSQGHK